MAQTLAEQLLTVERALGERMIESALLLVRAWMNELGEANTFEERHATIRKQYNDLFTRWLTSGEEEIEENLNNLTGEAYQLIDEVYAELRMKRGLSPVMHGFNADSIQSVMNYFMHCVRWRPEDLEWLEKQLNEEELDPEKEMIALMAVSALAVNMRECFSVDAMLVLIHGMNAENNMLANQCVTGVLKLLIQYDLRMDYLKLVQDAFIETMTDMGDGGDHVVSVLCALIDMSRSDFQHEYAQELQSMDEIPKVVEDIVRSVRGDDSKSAIIQWYPSTEREFMEGLLRMLPDTWLYHVLTDENPAIENAIVRTLLKSGFDETLWDHPDIAEKVYRSLLRKKGEKKPIDYVNYAHCLMLKGDRMMAYENYKQARHLCKNVKDFYSLFRPDRGNLVDHGVPVEQVYLMEDQLFNG